MKAIKILFFLLTYVTVVALPVSAIEQKTLSINWSYPNDIIGIAGFRVYNNNVSLCETTDPLARTLTCSIILSVEQNSISMTAFDTNYLESALSIPINYTYVPPSTNNPPVSSALSFSIQEDSSLTGLLNGYDPEGEPLTFSISTNPNMGQVALNNPATGAFTYTPNANGHGTDSFMYMVSDGVASSGTALVTITISSINDRPVATADNTITNEDTPVVITAPANDFDVDGDALRIVAVTSAGNGTTTITGNSISYTPALNYFGTDNFTYEVSDGLLTASASVNIVVNAVNDAPSAQNMNFSTPADALLSGRLSALDPEHSSLRFILTNLPALGTVEINSASGEFQYMPTNNVNAVDTFGFIVNDGQLDSSIAMVNITIQAVNHMPVADAGPDQTVMEGEDVRLNGSNSFDPDNNIASYEWTQIDGPVVLLSDPTAVQPTFASLDLQSGSVSLTFELTVKDQEGLISTDSSIVNITWVDEPPFADAGPDQTVSEGDTVMLDGSLSYDSDDGIADYFWEQITGPAVTLNDAYLEQPTFIAPETDMNGLTFSFRLTVTDVTGLRSQDSVIVNVTWVNNPPVADAGNDQVVYSKQTVMLDASRSQDSDDGIAQARWTQTSGLATTLSDPSAYNPTFVAPSTTSAEPTVLTFQVLVTDLGGLQSSDSVTVSVSAQSTAAPASIIVPVSDPDGTFNISWSASATPGATYTLQEATNSQFTADLRTAYNGTALYKKLTRRVGKTYYYRVRASKLGFLDSAWKTGANGCQIRR